MDRCECRRSKETEMTRTILTSVYVLFGVVACGSNDGATAGTGGAAGNASGGIGATAGNSSGGTGATAGGASGGTGATAGGGTGGTVTTVRKNTCIGPAAAAITAAAVPVGFCAWEWATDVADVRGIVVDANGNVLV